MTLIFRHRPNVFICLVFLVQTVFGGTTGKLAGRVTDKDKNEPLIGANVMVVGTTLGAATDLDGNYYVLQVPPGTYSIRFTMIGYQSLVINDVRVKVDLTTTINGALVESVVGLEEVVVQAERAMIQTDVTYSQANISSEEVDLLPVEEFQDVIALQAGVVVTGGDIHVRGGRGGEISYMVDGITVTDPYNAGVAIEIENNAIQELQFISGTFNAEYGQAMSGIVNIVTKDGDYNHFSGNLSLNGGSYFSKGDPSFTIIPGYETEPENEVNATDMNLFPRLDKFIPSTVQDLSGSLSGPVIPGRISFFASGRIKRDNGYLKGQRIFDPHSFIWVDENNNYEIDDSLGLGNGYVPSLSSRTAGESLRKAIDSLRRADEFDWISMDWSEQKTGQLKLSWRFTPRIKLSFNRMYSETHSQYYDHSYRWNPDGRPHEFQTNTGNLFRMDISLSQSTFANILFSNAVNHFRRHLSDDPDYHKQIQNEFDGWASDPLSDNLYEVDPKIFDFATGNNFYVGGQYMGIYNRKSIVNTLKTEITSQINSKHQIKS
ncbi:MAG: carboxypeptidase-like regulatory domain-containing protein, partial [Candidatus Marinimicrobia bacterium]|nr:carboxypeptidase-like regulatory domain-containing protein [Candidatus Neomarinimicrobiota bacterium]